MWFSLVLKLGIGSDSSVDLGFGVGLNLSRQYSAAGNSQASTNGLGSSASLSDSQNNAEIFQRLNQMLENCDQGNPTSESTSKRNFLGNELLANQVLVR